MEVVVFPPNRGVQWSHTVESTPWGMALGVTAVVDIVLGLAEIVPASCPSLRTAWSLLVYGLLYTALWRSVGPADLGPARTSSSCSGVCGPGPPGRSAVTRTRRSGGHVEVPGPLRGEVRDSVRVC